MVGRRRTIAQCDCWGGFTNGLLWRWSSFFFVWGCITCVLSFIRVDENWKFSYGKSSDVKINHCKCRCELSFVTLDIVRWIDYAWDESEISYVRKKWTWMVVDCAIYRHPTMACRSVGFFFQRQKFQSCTLLALKYASLDAWVEKKVDD